MLKIISTKRIAMMSMLAALCVATNYAMLPFANVKLMDGIVFASGYVLGGPMGVCVGVLAWAVYGQINPYGFSLPILLLTMSGESVYALGGALLRRSLSSRRGQDDVGLPIPRGLVFGTLGILLTLIYDVYTNAAVGVLSYGSPFLGLLTMNFPIPLGIIHELSNLAFFATVVPLLTKAMCRTTGLVDKAWITTRRAAGVG